MTARQQRSRFAVLYSTAAKGTVGLRSLFADRNAAVPILYAEAAMQFRAGRGHSTHLAVETPRLQLSGNASMDQTKCAAPRWPSCRHFPDFHFVGTVDDGSGLGVSIWPAALLRNVAQGNLVVRPLVAPAVSRSISVVTKRGRLLSAGRQAFVQTLTDDLARHADA